MKLKNHEQRLLPYRKDTYMHYQSALGGYLYKCAIIIVHFNIDSVLNSTNQQLSPVPYKMTFVKSLKYHLSIYLYSEAKCLKMHIKQIKLKTYNRINYIHTHRWQNIRTVISSKIVTGVREV